MNCVETHWMLTCGAVCFIVSFPKLTHVEFTDQPRGFSETKILWRHCLWILANLPAAGILLVQSCPLSSRHRNKLGGLSAIRSNHFSYFSSQSSVRGTHCVQWDYFLKLRVPIGNSKCAKRRLREMGNIRLLLLCGPFTEKSLFRPRNRWNVLWSLWWTLPLLWHNWDLPLEHTSTRVNLFIASPMSCQQVWHCG